MDGFENDEEIENPDMGVDLPNIDVENDFEGEFAEQVTPEIANLENIENESIQADIDSFETEGDFDNEFAERNTPNFENLNELEVEFDENEVASIEGPNSIEIEQTNWKSPALSLKTTSRTLASPTKCRASRRTLALRISSLTARSLVSRMNPRTLRPTSPITTSTSTLTTSLTSRIRRILSLKMKTLTTIQASRSTSMVVTPAVLPRASNSSQLARPPVMLLRELLMVTVTTMIPLITSSMAMV